MVAVFSKIPANKRNMVSMTLQTEVKSDSLQIAMTEIHNYELEEECYGLQRDFDRETNNRRYTEEIPK